MTRVTSCFALRETACSYARRFSGVVAPFGFRASLPTSTARRAQISARVRVA
jgi:hypothetical protein